MHIRMIKTRNYRVDKHGRVRVKFSAGATYPAVKKDWAEDMIAKGEAEAVPTPRRKPASEADA